MRRISLQVAQRSCIGERTRNEDCLAVERQGGYWCLVLSDGAGGHGGGAQASRLVVQRVLLGFRSRPPVDSRDLSELLLDAHDEVLAGQRSTARADGDAQSSMYATVVVLVIDTLRGTAIWGHVGDSRLYQWRAGILTTVTRDDSVVQSMIDSGLLKAEDAEQVRNRGVLLAALGTAEEATPHVSAALDLQTSDSFLLCSDGWWGGLEPPVLGSLLTDAATPDDWLDAMVTRTSGLQDPRQDNYSAIACWIGDAAAADVDSSLDQQAFTFEAVAAATSR